MKDKSKYLGNELKYIKQVLKSGKLTSTSGDFVYHFEQQFAKEFGAKYAIACNSGTSALHMALEGVGVGYGDEVIVPALSVIMNTTSVLHANAIPIYVDIDGNSFTIDPKDVKKKITSKTKAIVAVSLYGYPSKIEELKKIANGIPIIEDNAEHLGKLRSEVAVYSLEGTKHLSAGEMGVVVTNNEDIALKARLLANHGFKTTKADNGKTKSDVSVFQNPDFERHNFLGWNYRATEFQAAIALAQLEKKDEILKRRKKFAYMLCDVFGKRYSDKHMNIDVVTNSLVVTDFIIQEKYSDHTFWTLAVRYMGSKEKWKLFHKKFIENGGDGFWSAWKVQYLEPLMKDGIFKKRCPQLYDGLVIDRCVVAEIIQPQIMQFKLNYRSEKLFKKQVDILRKTLKEFE